MSQRLEIRKTYKLHIGGNFVRSESGRVLPANSPDGKLLDNVSRASRKDFRDAVTAARNAFEGWRKKTAYLRAQILYRAAEMLQKRTSELAQEIQRSTGCSDADAATEVAGSIDRLVYFAGWTDKYEQVFGSINPVATSHFNASTIEPTGVVAAVAPDEPALLGLVSIVAPAILSGNSCIVLASEKFPLPGLTFAEIVATSDLPPGVVNILSGTRRELAPHIASHMDVNAIVDASGEPEISAQLQAGSALNVKRCARRMLSPEQWRGSKGQDAYWILETTELKTCWHPVGI